VRADAVPTRGLTHDRDVARVAAEPRDVLAHPAQRDALVGDAEVAGVGPERRVGKKTEHAEAVVDRDGDDVSPLHQRIRAVVGA
jgi:hypothetical protein